MQIRTVASAIFASPRVLCAIAGLAVVATIFAVSAHLTYPFFRQASAIAAIEKLNGHVKVYYLKPSRVGQIMERVGGDRFKDQVVVRVDLNDTIADDQALQCLSAFDEIYYLDLSSTAISDDGLANIRHCSKLGHLSLRNTRIGDAGVRSLRNFQKLHILSLSGTAVTDAAIDDLSQLKSLRVIMLKDTKVSKSGIERLQRQLPNLVI